ncbi:MAG: isoprenylcysteine carboxylmethyltransferase family protein [Ignavibacteria bacterium]|nr:isoprenylcysteine carboxylmethyltransferase family protein [Ignavibacteria bacterium]
MTKIIIFLLLTAGMVAVSWRSFADPLKHGFFRFFAFESLFVLILLNVDHWFVDPFSPVHITSWCLLLASLLLAIHGFSLLFEVGKPKDDFEDTTVLVRTGAYKYIRHPLYSSLLIGSWGVFLKDPSQLATALALAASAFLFLTARVEEVENLRKFGQEYESYMKTTKMFVPFVF